MKKGSSHELPFFLSLHLSGHLLHDLRRRGFSDRAGEGAHCLQAHARASFTMPERSIRAIRDRSAPQAAMRPLAPRRNPSSAASSGFNPSPPEECESSRSSISISEPDVYASITMGWM